MQISYQHKIDTNTFEIIVECIPAFSTNPSILFNHGEHSYVIKDYHAYNLRTTQTQNTIQFDTIMDIIFVIPDNMNGVISCKIINENICYQNRGFY